jgi:hypothetical protein
MPEVKGFISLFRKQGHAFKVANVLEYSSGSR